MKIRPGMRIGVKPTGPDGTFTRLDHLRGAGLAAIVGVVLIMISWGVIFIGDRLGHGKPPGWMLGTMIFCSLGLILAFAWCVVSLIRALIGK